MRRFRFALAPRWLALHLLVLTVCVAMVLLGRWQLHVSEHKHFSLQNFGYAVQWWAFTAFAVLIWVRVLRDASRRPGLAQSLEVGAAQVAAEPIPYRRYVMPQGSSRTSESDDATHQAYNEYLASLAADAEAKHSQ